MIIYVCYSDRHIYSMCSAHISPDQSCMCASFEDSTVRLWSLNSSLLNTRQPSANTTQVHLSGDHRDDVDEKNRSDLQIKSVGSLY